MEHFSSPRVDGSRIADARRRCGLTQEQLARELSVSVNSVVKWEAGDRSPGSARLYAIAKRLGQPIPWFFNEDGEKVA